MNAARRFGKSGVPRPVIGSHPGAAGNPSVPQPGLVPFVMSLNAPAAVNASEYSYVTCARASASTRGREVNEGWGTHGGVDEPDGAFAGREACVVDRGDEGGKDGRGGGRAACEHKLAPLGDHGGEPVVGARERQH